MSLLPGYLLLLVAEQAGFSEIQALRATCKFNRSLLDRNEHSVTKANTSRYPYAPCNHILASDTREREVLPLDTFDTIRELQTRQRNIDELVNGNFLDFWDEYDLDYPSKADFIRGSLRNALWRCSEMADLETHSIKYRDDVVPRRDPCVKSLIHQDLILRDAPPPDGWHLALKEVHDSNRQDVRLRQIAHIRECLGASDLAGILVLAHLTSQGYMRYRAPTSARSRPEIVEMGVCMAENVLRHGVFFLHAKIKGGEDAHDHAKLLLDDTYEEMRRWETGDPSVMAGLTMTVVARFCEVVGCERKDYLTAACTLVRGDVWKKEEDEGEGEDDEREKEDGLPDGEGAGFGEMA
ncbi:hypothetical protein CkaCkLH20_05911 [Colletotrichum karsti]|uniref:F-box domain-containing protein n=1 Tax=Colletotrichum karsti TaxID=1095194 RepID=A0A9P6I392_9PEZI|nr:uncharacterized protein CkaCkLH20_05911 [Colletotrichum karsti]KAF9876503.1 hypothetical protein CkaCkLH20_05911 [Colletotrichum karsti]